MNFFFLTRDLVAALRLRSNANRRFSLSASDVEMERLWDEAAGVVGFPLDNWTVSDG